MLQEIPLAKAAEAIIWAGSCSVDDPVGGIVHKAIVHFASREDADRFKKAVDDVVNERQRINSAYGNLKMHSDAVTIEDIERAAMTIKDCTFSNTQKPLESIEAHNARRSRENLAVAEAAKHTGVACGNCGKELLWDMGVHVTELVYRNPPDTTLPATCPGCHMTYRLER